MITISNAERGVSMIENPERLQWSRQEIEDFLLAFDELLRDLTEISERGVGNGNSKCNTAAEEATGP